MPPKANEELRMARDFFSTWNALAVVSLGWFASIHDRRGRRVEWKDYSGQCPYLAFRGIALSESGRPVPCWPQAGPGKLRPELLEGPKRQVQGGAAPTGMA